MDELLDDTLKFFLKAIASELHKEIDWRAKGHGKSLIKRAVIYAAAFVRDLTRIPRHYHGGIGQAQFRFRVAYISDIALPTLSFFLTKYPLQQRQQIPIEAAVDLLQQGANLIRDGKIPALDEWYATMEEFGQLTECSRQAAKRIEEAIHFKR